MPDNFPPGNTPPTHFESPRSDTWTITVPYEVVSRRPVPPRKSRYSLNILLFILTFFTTLVAGALQHGVDPIAEPGRIVEGAPFAVTLMLILLTHELGHYLTSRYHRVDASLPFFIPAPNFIGTFGAVIKMRSRLRSRRALIDIGASGPLSGFVVSIFAVILGLRISPLVPIHEIQQIQEYSTEIILGNSLIIIFLKKVFMLSIPEGQDILLHSVYFAGWIGLFVTMLNLIPFGQLDGGHITYALLGGGLHRIVGITIIPILLMLGYITGSFIWMVWAVLLFIIRPGHPPVLESEPVLPAGRRRLGWTTMLIFILTFIPVPFQVI